MSCQERAQAAETWGKEPVGTSGGALKVVASAVEAGANHISEFLKLNGAAVHRFFFAFAIQQHWLYFLQ